MGKNGDSTEHERQERIGAKKEVKGKGRKCPIRSAISFT